MSQGTPKIARKVSVMQKHPEEIVTDLKKDSLLMPCSWIPSLQKYKTKKMLIFKVPILWYLLQ